MGFFFLGCLAGSISTCVLIVLMSANKQEEIDREVQRIYQSGYEKGYEDGSSLMGDRK